LLERRYAAAESLASVTIAMDSTFVLAWTRRANALLGMGKADEAVAMLEPHAAALSAGKPEELHGTLAYAYACAGRPRDARSMLQSMRVRSGGRLPATGAVAATLEELGDHEAAVSLFGEAIARHDVSIVIMPRLYRYDRLREDPRVAAMFDRRFAR
jgi:pentatricopeptide repeat protein